MLHAPAVSSTEESDHVVVVPFVRQTRIAEALEKGRYGLDVSTRPSPEVEGVPEWTVRRILRSQRVVTARFTTREMSRETGVLTTRANSEPLKKAIFYLLGRSYPNLIMQQLSSQFIRNILEGIQSDTGWEIRNGYAVAYPMDRSGGARIERKPVELQELLEELWDHNRVLRNLRFKGTDNDGTVQLDAYISHEGFLRFYQGDPTAFERLLMQPVLDMASTDYERLSGRSRTSERPSGRPVQIEFAREALAQRENLERLCDVLAELDNTSISVFHLNPHLHLGFLDYADASTLDICMTGASTLRIIPSYKTSQASLVRVCRKIVSDYEDGRVVTDAQAAE